jgi:proteasome beta subunit
MEDWEKSILKTGTTTVGVVCKDGIVLAADKRATADFFIANKETQKVFKITDNIAVTVAGVVSDIQLILKLTKAELRLKSVRTKMLPTVKEASNLFASIVYQNIRKFSPIMGISSFIVAGKDSTGFSMYQIGADGSVQEYANYVTTGAYGSFIAYGILENEWRANISIEEGRKIALKVISTAIKRDASVGDGAFITVIDNNGVGEIKEEKL